MACRICYEPCTHTSGCRCKGSLRHIHPHCLAAWQRASGKHTCELCGYVYRTRTHALVFFCIGVIAREHLPWCLLTVLLPNPFYYIAAGAYVSTYCSI